VLDHGPYVALGLLVVWIVLVFLPLVSPRKAASFAVASTFIALMAPVFWLAPEITELSISHIGTFKTNVEQASSYFEQIKSIRDKVEAEDQAIAATVASINQRASEQLEYYDDARLNAMGSVSIGGPGVEVMANSEINNIIAPYVHPAADLHGQWDCTPAALDAYSKAISHDGKFPFAYYYRATCRKAVGEGDWQQDIQKARDILLITTRLPGHHSDHDALLKRINDGNLTNGN
jgi:hypothetical protein